ncbi:flagellar hook-length control protein FliK [Alcaligenaceae bacterium]|nr:flagellar hook-length control protein FliK [Alcaligenaceae bacterium]
MNTATISPALDMLATKPATAQASKTPEADNDSPRFADVLSQQHTKHAPETDKRTDQDAAPKNINTDTADARPATDKLDSELARLAAQSGLIGQLLPVDSTVSRFVLQTDPRADMRQLREAATTLTQARQRSAPDVKVDHDTQQDQPLPRTGTLPATPSESAAILASLIKSEPTANGGTNDRNLRSDISSSTHQSATGNSTKAKAPVTLLGNAPLTTGANKIADLGPGKIAINEFSTAMVDAANLARARMSGTNVTDAGSTIASTNANDQVAHLASQLLPSSAPANTTGSTLSIAAPLTSPQWGTDFGRQFVTMLQNSTNGSQIAELRLDPPELGPLRITLNLSDNIAHAAFYSPHAAVRQTVENALPQLQELLAQSGISLGDTSVNDQSQTAQDFNNPGNQKQPAGSNRSTDNGGLMVAANDTPAVTRTRSPDALVDTFA